MAQAQRVKSEKRDFEIITQVQNELHLFGSGSTTRRNGHYIYHLTTGKVQVFDRSQHYQLWREQAHIPVQDFNLEGAVFYQNHWYFFQRGNGAAQKNGIFTATEHFEFVTYHPVELPHIKGVRATFTDAVLVGDFAYFLAAAEASDSTYLDGAIAGSLLGKLNLKTFAIEFTQEISDTQKFEGICWYQKSAEKIEFLLCEDSDAEVSETVIYKLIVD